MSSTPFGEHLRREREMRGVSLEEISAATRISTRFLEALEGEQWDRLPGGAFNRGFVRSIARFLGIDEDALVAEYSFERRDFDGAQAVVARPVKLSRNWRPIVFTSLALLLLLVAILFTHHRYGGWIAAHLHKRLARAAASNQANDVPKRDLDGSEGASVAVAWQPRKVTALGNTLRQLPEESH